MGRKTVFITAKRIHRASTRITRLVFIIFRKRARWRLSDIWTYSRGDYVLDLCAAPRRKSTQIGAAMQGKGILVCNEIHPARAKILSENVERMGLTNAVVTNESPERLSAYFPEYFDKILVDAPCSGEGMFRKHEEACSEWSPENVELCAKRQDSVLDEAAAMLKKRRQAGIFDLYVCDAGG